MAVIGFPSSLFYGTGIPAALLIINKHKDLKMEGVEFKTNSNDLISISYKKDTLSFGEIVNYLNANDVKIEDISTEDGDLEDVFVQLTKH